jgi:hypothetical protein
LIAGASEKLFFSRKIFKNIKRENRTFLLFSSIPEQQISFPFH